MNKFTIRALRPEAIEGSEFELVEVNEDYPKGYCHGTVEMRGELDDAAICNAVRGKWGLPLNARFKVLRLPAA